MAETKAGGGYALSEISTKISMKFPEKEKRKLEFFTKKVPQLDKFYKAFSAGGAAAIGAGAGLLAAAATMTFSSRGFKQVLGAMWDILGLISDLIFLTLWPVIKPMIQALMQFARSLMGHSGGKGILGALEDPKVWEKFGKVIGKAVVAFVQTSRLFIKVGIAFIRAIKPFLPEIAHAIFVAIGLVFHAIGELIYDAMVWAAKSILNLFVQGFVKIGETLYNIYLKPFVDAIYALRDFLADLIQRLGKGVGQIEQGLAGPEGKGPLGWDVLPGIHSTLSNVTGWK